MEFKFLLFVVFVDLQTNPSKLPNYPTVQRALVYLIVWVCTLPLFQINQFVELPPSLVLLRNYKELIKSLQNKDCRLFLWVSLGSIVKELEKNVEVIISVSDRGQ
jgi:hypothetical protein